MKSEKSFRCYFRFLVALFIFEIIVGAAIAGVCEYLKQLVQNRVFELEKSEVLNIFFVVKLFGLHVSFYFLSGVPMVFLFNEVYTTHMGFVLKLWILLAVETATGSLFMIWCFDDAVKSLIARFESSLSAGIKLYPQNPIWVLIWDDLQYEFKCCGVYSHKDWMNLNLTETGKHKKHLSWLPFSCASGNVPAKVGLTDENIHIEGCFKVVSRIVEQINTAVVSLNLVVIVLLVSL